MAGRPRRILTSPDELRHLDAALVVAHEWLDVVPCPVAELDDRGVLRHLLVDPATGEESPSATLLDGADLAGRPRTGRPVSPATGSRSGSPATGPGPTSWVG